MPMRENMEKNQMENVLMYFTLQVNIQLLCLNHLCTAIELITGIQICFPKRVQLIEKRFTDFFKLECFFPYISYSHLKVTT